jgi:hypothetical protein
VPVATELKNRVCHPFWAKNVENHPQACVRNGLNGQWYGSGLLGQRQLNPEQKFEEQRI